MSQPIFQQLFEHESSTYTYLIADSKTKKAAIIDPVIETVDRDEKLIKELGLELVYILDTHVHADHITGAGELRRRTGAKSAVNKDSKIECMDIPLNDGDVLSLGDITIKAISTPGHTDSCMSFICENKVFTGDALLIRAAGRTDFQQGSAEKLYESVTQKLFKLPDDTIVYPGHDYRGFTSSTIGAEKQHNPRIGIKNTKADFVKIMGELKLAHPKKIQEALPANLVCGNKPAEKIKTNNHSGISEVSVEEVFRTKGKYVLIDVRRPEEFNNELGHIEGAQLITLGNELSTYLQKNNKEAEIIFVCRSGARSGNAALEAMHMGYQQVHNMVGGMIAWNERNLPITRR